MKSAPRAGGNAPYPNEPEVKSGRAELVKIDEEIAAGADGDSWRDEER